MKNKNGFAPIVVVLIAAAVVLAGGSYYLGKVSKSNQPEKASENISESGIQNSGDAEKSAVVPVVTYSEDGEHDGYVIKAYEKDGKKYVDIDYFVTILGKEAILKALEYKESKGYFLPPAVKADFLSRVNAMKNENDYGESVYIPMRSMYPGEAVALALPDFPNGVALDLNENSKIRTFEVSLKSEGIIFATLFSSVDQVGVTKKTSSGGGFVFVVNWDIFKQEVIKSQSYGMLPVRIQVENGKIVDMIQIYRP